MAFDKYRNVVCVVCGNVFLHPTTIYVDVSRRAESNGRGFNALRQALVSYERKLTFHEISLCPMMSRICSDSDGPRTQKNVVLCIEILLFAALALIAYKASCKNGLCGTAPP